MSPLLEEGSKVSQLSQNLAVSDIYKLNWLLHSPVREEMEVQVPRLSEKTELPGPRLMLCSPGSGYPGGNLFAQLKLVPSY